MDIYIAVDFETADYKPDSACAIGLAKSVDGVITDTFYSLIKPPRKRFYFSHIHGLTWQDVAHSPTFLELWQQIADFSAGAKHFVAHNATFDKRVLNSCLMAAGLPPSDLPFLCTLRLSRKHLKLPSHSLSALCSHFKIPLDHHHAGSDALACMALFHHLNELKNDTLSNAL